MSGKITGSQARHLLAKHSQKSKGGMHVGRPHTSENDPRIHVTSTLRDSDGKKVRNDTHQSSLGAIAYGWAAYEDNQEKK
jgi:hypothetical protein